MSLYAVQNIVRWEVVDVLVALGGSDYDNLLLDTTRGERQEAVRILTRRGKTAREISIQLGMTMRSITRLRSREKHR